MPETAELQKSTGGYMSVDAAAAVEHNQQLIDNLRQAFRQAVANPPVPEQPQEQQLTPPKPAK